MLKVYNYITIGSTSSTDTTFPRITSTSTTNRAVALSDASLTFKLNSGRLRCKYSKENIYKGKLQPRSGYTEKTYGKSDDGYYGVYLQAN